MKLQIFFGILLRLIFLLFFVNQFACQTLQFHDDKERFERGKVQYKRLQESSTKTSRCWKSALKQLDQSCRDMSDMEQSFLALQFANCHLSKSGLQTYPCAKEDFRKCTQLMGKDIIAFQTYTEFFTHVTDICFYLQSDIWRENTEETISKLVHTSSESLNTLLKSAEKQQDVLDAQQKSLENQKDMLLNEQILKETLKTSAESAKNVFEEVKEHAQQQKTLFSDTFEHIFQSVEKLANLQEMLLGEFIGLQSVAFYFVASVVCYLFTSTPRTAGARLLLFIGLTILILAERLFVSWKVNSNVELSSEGIHSRIWILRKVYLAIATIILGWYISRYKDFNKINYNMLQDIQLQILELKKLQESQQTLVTKMESKSNDSSAIDGIEEDKTLVDTRKHLEEATKQLEMSLQAYATSTPQKHQANTLLLLQSPFQHHPAEERTTTLLHDFSDEDEQKKMNNKDQGEEKRKTKKSKKDNTVLLNESKYNLRSRQNSQLMTSSCFNQSRLNTTVVKKRATPKRKPRKNTKETKKPAFFSSDDEA